MAGTRKRDGRDDSMKQRIVSTLCNMSKELARVIAPALIETVGTHLLETAQKMIKDADGLDEPEEKEG